jgi:hypothetical protein
MREPTFIERLHRRGLTATRAGFCGLFLTGVAGCYIYSWYSFGQLFYRPGIWITYHDHPVEFVFAASTVIFFALAGIAFIVAMLALMHRQLKYPLGIEVERFDDEK